MKEKKFFYLNGFFRCGNTILRSIINQNPNFCITANSITPEIIYRLILLKDNDIFKEQNDHKSFDNVLKNVLNNYYSGWKQQYIIEQGPWGTSFNYNALKELGHLPSKFIFLIRPLHEIIASWVRLHKPEEKDLRQYYSDLLGEYGKIGKSFLAFKHILENDKENLLIIKYKDLCKNPNNAIKNLYDFLKIPFYKNHKFTNLNQVDTKQDQTIIRTDEIKIKTYDYEKYVDRSILKNYTEINEIFKKYSS
jgi:hypothetical protein